MPCRPPLGACLAMACGHIPPCGGTVALTVGIPRPPTRKTDVTPRCSPSKKVIVAVSQVGPVHPKVDPASALLCPHDG
eukprot:313980-Prymnesium_polylepis.1